jgi:hypothetical protein
MTTEDVISRAMRAQQNTVGWQFARQLSDPSFRQRLRDLGWAPDGVGRVYPVPQDETAESVIALMGSGRHLLVEAATTEAHGMRVRIVEVPA